MGQQFPYKPNGQFPALQQNLMPQHGFGQQGGMMPPVAMQNPGIQGVDPAMLAAAQQSVANPNEGDDVSFMPGPKEAILGGLGGIGMAMGLTTLEDKNVIFKIAQKLDTIPGLSFLSKHIEKPIQEIATAKTGFWAQKGWVQDTVKEWLHAPALRATGPDGATQAAKDAVHAMQQRQLGNTLGYFHSDFAKNSTLTEVYKSLVTDKTGFKTWLNSKDFEELLKNHNPKYQNALNANNKELAGKILAKSKETARLSILDPEKLAAIQKAGFKKVGLGAEAQLAYLKSLPARTKDQKQLLKHLNNLANRLGGLTENYGVQYADQAKLVAKLKAKNVGPIGRTFASGVNYLKRIFNGDTMRTGAKKAGEKSGGLMAFAGKAWMPAMAGMFIFGQSIQKAKKAKEGDKLKAFFHDFIGTGIGSFLGWEVGRKVLNTTLASKLLGSLSVKTLIPRFIPLLGGTTVAGFLIEIVSMFVFGAMFQKVGEKISHAIFGKPPEDENKDDKTKNQMGGGLPQQQQSLPGYLPQATMGRMQPGFQQAGRQNNVSGYPGPVGRGPYNPAAQQRQVPKFSITPDMIRHSKAAQDYEVMEDQVLNQARNMKQRRGLSFK